MEAQLSLWRQQRWRQRLRHGFLLAYEQPKRKPHQKSEPYHVSWLFDLAVVTALVIVGVGYLMA